MLGHRDRTYPASVGG